MKKHKGHHMEGKKKTIAEDRRQATPTSISVYLGRENGEARYRREGKMRPS
jgi:hypothetical protein